MGMKKLALVCVTVITVSGMFSIAVVGRAALAPEDQRTRSIRVAGDRWPGEEDEALFGSGNFDGQKGWDAFTLRTVDDVALEVVCPRLRAWRNGFRKGTAARRVANDAYGSLCINDGTDYGKEVQTVGACQKLEAFTRRVITGRTDVALGSREGDRLHRQHMREGSPFSHEDHTLVSEAYLSACQEGYESPAFFWRYGPTS
jgi:hypothetical protein